ncbi:hypothetical protein HMPREF3033_01765 [Veillonellaceae bacterium DNF00751]|uniref:Uncharacterized protein n=1 Tax=Megasphaera lornae TaxID=1000568 RepID=A0ABP2L4J4_9FIRM|nr:hypothetical protein HMPREF1039_0353 [Megasphaera lornae]KXB89436.1 hypothetical protein HMPREF3033_01765 [Veillonellaceae bacterium DNF00751]
MIFLCFSEPVCGSSDSCIFGMNIKGAYRFRTLIKKGVVFG